MHAIPMLGICGGKGWRRNVRRRRRRRRKRRRRRRRERACQYLAVGRRFC
jgi:hypothetical protein